MSIFPKLFSLPVMILLAWMGANIYQDNELFANPFEKQSLLDKLEYSNADKIEEGVEDGIEDGLEKAKESFKKGIDGIKESIKDASE